MEIKNSSILERGDAWRREKERERRCIEERERKREDEIAQQNVHNCVEEVHVLCLKALRKMT